MFPGLRSRRRPPCRRLPLLLTAAALASGLLTAVDPLTSTAAADDPLFVDWPSLLPGLTDEYDPTSENDCVAGRPHCVDATIREMQRRFEPLGRDCEHNAIFALAYLRTTQTYEWARDQDGFFTDTAFVNHEDAVFAKYYFRAYDAWADGRRDEAPPAWLIAFDNARDRRVTGSGNLLLGMNAHVNRDLPIALAAIGIVGPDGTSRKGDHDKVNEFLNTVVQPLLLEASARFDPDVVNIQTPYGAGYTGLFQTLQAWREAAWRNAENLARAETPEEKATVLAEIESGAATQALTLAAANAYVPPVTTSASRDSYCAAHNADPPPMDYAFGTATAYG